MTCHTRLRPHRRRHHDRVLPAAALLAAALLPAAARAEPPLVFRDVAEEAGLMPAVGGIAGHAAAWGDYDGDGWPDLYVGTFGGEPYGSKPNMLFRNAEGRFEPVEQPPLQLVGRASGSIFADLDNDGDLDLYLSNHAIHRSEGQLHYETPNALFRNDGGTFTDVSAESGTSISPMAARSVAAVDFDGDGLLDLLVGEDYFQGGQRRTRLLRNLGELRFEDVTAAAGLPEQVTALGVAAGDVTGDTWPDLLLFGRNGGERLFINGGAGRFREVPPTHADFRWEYPPHNGDNTSCGVALGDVDGDGRLDVLVGSHFSAPWAEPVSMRLYLNRGMDGEWPRFEEVTEAAGLVPLPMKSPHVEVQDFDNDGRPDLYTSIVLFDSSGRPRPVIFRNLGLTDGVPRFRTDALEANDFPTPEDQALRGSHEFGQKMVAERKVIYMAAAPSADFDRDGRLDLFLANWWVKLPSLLLRNETQAGHWLQVRVEDVEGVNRQGVGAHVRLYEPGRLGDDAALLGMAEVAVGYGYSSGQEALVHLGLGERTRCDIEVRLPHGKGTLVRRDVEADQAVTLGEADQGER